jgi:hypothetical protein
MNTMTATSSDLVISNSVDPYSYTNTNSFAMSVQDMVFECLRSCSNTLRSLQRLPQTSISSELISHVKLVASSLSSVNNIFYETDRDLLQEIENNSDLERLFQLTIRPCSLTFAAILNQVALTSLNFETSDIVFRPHLSLVRSLRSGMTILTSTLQKYVLNYINLD